MLQRATGKPYARLLADRVAAPLGLTRLQFTSLASAAIATPVGTMADGSAESAFNLASFGVGGAIVGTADALWQFDRALGYQGEAVTLVTGHRPTGDQNQRRKPKVTPCFVLRASRFESLACC